jgi:hypothetical protein
MAMNRSFTFEGRDYDTDSMSPEARALLQALAFAQDRLQELTNQQALLIRARNGYILDLKTEIEAREAAKVDVSALLVSE